MEKALIWWGTLTRQRQEFLADNHYWSTADKMSDESILFIYNEEHYGY